MAGARRDDVVITTKVRFAVTDPGGEGLAPERIRAACDASLRRLGIDTIDLYQIHGPDPTVPIEDVLETLDELVRAGKVRALGVSNFPAWLLAWALRTQDAEGWAPFIALQAQYSLVERSAELELLPLCRSTGLRLTPWGPLGGGFLTGRHTRGGEPAPGSRLADAPDGAEEALHRRATERNFRLVEETRAIAAEARRHRPAGRHRLAPAPAAASAHRSSAPARCRSSRTSCPPPPSPSAMNSYAGSRLHTPPPVVYPNRMLADQDGTDPEQNLKRAQGRALPA